MMLDPTARRSALEDVLEGVPWTEKKRLIKQFRDHESELKAANEADPKTIVRGEYRRGTLTAFAANDLMRLYEVMEQAESATKLEAENRKRLAHFAQSLDLRHRGAKALQKKDFESYERKKRDQLFAWQKAADPVD